MTVVNPDPLDAVLDRVRTLEKVVRNLRARIVVLEDAQATAGEVPGQAGLFDTA